MVPKIHMPIIDVRDVALAHLRAMVIKQAAGIDLSIHTCKVVELKKSFAWKSILST